MIDGNGNGGKWRLSIFKDRENAWRRDKGSRGCRTVCRRRARKRVRSICCIKHEKGHAILYTEELMVKLAGFARWGKRTLFDWFFSPMKDGCW